MQLLPDTAQGIAVRTGGNEFVVDDLYVPEINVRYGAWYLRHLLDRYGDERTALAAYHAGQGNVDKWRRQGVGIQFPETRSYVDKVEQREGDLRRRRTRRSSGCVSVPRDGRPARPQLRRADRRRLPRRPARLAGARRRQPAGAAAARGDLRARVARRGAYALLRVSFEGFLPSSLRAGSPRRRSSWSRRPRRCSCTRSDCDALVFVVGSRQHARGRRDRERADRRPAGAPTGPRWRG